MRKRSGEMPLCLVVAYKVDPVACAGSTVKPYEQQATNLLKGCALFVVATCREQLKCSHAQG